VAVQDDRDGQGEAQPELAPERGGMVAVTTVPAVIASMTAMLRARCRWRVPLQIGGCVGMVIMHGAILDGGMAHRCLDAFVFHSQPFSF
jgi:hypothetical protein